MESGETIDLTLVTGAGYSIGTATAVSSTLANDDTAGIVVTQPGGNINIAEGGATDSYTVVLTSVPTSAVTVTLTPDAQINLSSGADTPITLTFAADTTALTPQTVTTTAVDDTTAQGDRTGTIGQAVSSVDTNYNGLALSPITANITDNDISYAIAPGAPSILEGNSSTAPITFTITRQALRRSPVQLG